MNDWKTTEVGPLFTPEEQRRIDELLQKAKKYPEIGEFPTSSGLCARMVFTIDERLGDDDVKLMTRYLGVTYPEGGRLVTEHSLPSSTAATQPATMQVYQFDVGKKPPTLTKAPPYSHLMRVNISRREAIDVMRTLLNQMNTREDEPCTLTLFGELARL